VIGRIRTTLATIATVLVTATALTTPAARATTTSPPSADQLLPVASTGQATLAPQVSTAQYLGSDSCSTSSGTGYSSNALGQHLMSFTVSVWYCVHKSSTTLGPVYNWVYKIITPWSSGTVDQHVQHHVFTVGSVAWSYQGLDSSGNWGPNLTRSGGLSVERTGHFHLDLGWGPFALHQDRYLYVDIELGPTGAGTVYWGDHS
jgi:hypothetical protein